MNAAEVDRNPKAYRRLRLGTIALQMFRGGQDTYDISAKIGVSEAECVEMMRLARGKDPEG